MTSDEMATRFDALARRIPDVLLRAERAYELASDAGSTSKSVASLAGNLLGRVRSIEALRESSRAARSDDARRMIIEAAEHLTAEAERLAQRIPG